MLLCQLHKLSLSILASVTPFHWQWPFCTPNMPSEFSSQNYLQWSSQDFPMAASFSSFSFEPVSSPEGGTEDAVGGPARMPLPRVCIHPPGAMGVGCSWLRPLSFPVELPLACRSLLSWPGSGDNGSNLHLPTVDKGWVMKRLAAFTSDGSDGKEFTCNEGNPSSIPGLGRSLDEGNGNPLQYSYLENPMDRGAWWVQSTRSQKDGHDWATNTGRDTSGWSDSWFGASHGIKLRPDFS